MELNASGLSKACEEMFPSRRMLEEAMKLGIPLTLGSDAHQPMKLGEHLDQAGHCYRSLAFGRLRPSVTGSGRWCF